MVNTQLISIQKELDHRHSQLLKVQQELEGCCPSPLSQYIEQLIKEVDQNHLSIIKSQPIKIQDKNLGTDEKRLLVLSRLQATKTFENMGIFPWTFKSNHAYDICQKPCVTVVITLYNYAEYIYECLDSISKSDFTNISDIEVLVINDCSTDNSANLVTKYLETSNLPICLVNKWFNTGLANARNVGLKLARSPYLFILDADNWIYPHCLSSLYNSIKDSAHAAVYGEISRFDNITKKEINRISCYEWNVSQLVKQPYIDAMAMFNRDIILKVGGYSTELIEYGWFGWDDYDLWLKIAQSNYSCKFVPQVLSAYRVHSTSMINTTNKYALNLAKYFYHKFADLNHQNTSEMMFGFTKSEILSATSLHLFKSNILEVAELQQAKAKIKAMQSSKFWWLRNQWFNLKKFTGLAKDIDIKV